MLKECAVVYDLLPNYIEDLTQPQTNQYIEQHIEICPNCKQTLERMTEEIEIEEVSNQEAEIDYLKGLRKYVQQFQIYGIIVTLLLLLAIISIIFLIN